MPRTTRRGCAYVCPRSVPRLAKTGFSPLACDILVSTGRSLAQELTKPASIAGAWRIAGEIERVMIVTPNHWSQTIYDLEEQKFVRTFVRSYPVISEAATAGSIRFRGPETRRRAFPGADALGAQ